jgi:NADP-dependent aldehyde dehydrogenase
MPEGVFSLLHAADPEVSLSVVQHPAAKAVAFTGSERAGRAIFNAAAQRPQPIPAYVEMGSVNPVFVLPGGLRDADALAQGLFNSINLGVGQFCTCPGVVIGEGEGFTRLRSKLEELFEQAAPGTMLHPGILNGYKKGIEERSRNQGVRAIQSKAQADERQTHALPVFFETNARTWLNDEELGKEIFGPTSIAVEYANREELLSVAENLEGTLTASVFGTREDLREFRDLISILETKAGRLLFNGFPTGVEVSHAMHHGGPYPATADPKYTSVGTASIFRFLRPVCYQNFPEALLPPELQNANPRGIWRLIDGKLTRDPL